MLWLSAEPLLGPVDLTNALTGNRIVNDKVSHGPAIDWVIVGGESGRHLAGGKNSDRWMDQAWAQSIRDQCRAAGVAFFFKQSSGVRSGTSEELDGEIVHEYPRSLPLPTGAQTV